MIGRCRLSVMRMFVRILYLLKDLSGQICGEGGVRASHHWTGRDLSSSSPDNSVAAASELSRASWARRVFYSIRRAAAVPPLDLDPEIHI